MRGWLAGVLFLLGLVLAGPVLAQPDPAVVRQARALLEATTAADGPGAAMLVLKGDRVVFRQARGMADIELGVPLDPDQTFRIASITKTFTAATVVRLAQQGKLSLDDPLSRFLPDFPGASRITIRRMLNHTAGLSDVPSGTSVFRRDPSTADLVAEIALRPPTFEPGARQAYSNAGYVLLGAVIEAATGKPWPEAVREELLSPLGLDHTLYGGDGPIVPGRVSGYTTDTPDRAPANARYINLAGPAAAGALIGTVDDLGAWMRALGEGRAVGADGWREMSTPPALPEGQVPDYGLGVYLWTVHGRPMIGHTGQINGFASIAAYLPQDDVTIVVLANDDRFDARQIGRRLAAIAVGEPYPAVIARAPTAEELADLPGVYGDDPATTRTLVVQDGALFAQRPGRAPYPLQVAQDGRLHFRPDEISYFQVVRDASGHVTGLDYRRDGEEPAQRLARRP